MLVLMELAVVSPPYRLGLSVAQTISCCMCKTNGWKQMRDDYWFAYYGRVGVYWHLGHWAGPNRHLCEQSIKTKP